MMATSSSLQSLTQQVVGPTWSYLRTSSHTVFVVARYLAPRDFHVAGQRVPTDRKGVSVL